MGQKQKRTRQKEHATGQDRRTREEIYKKRGIKLAALRFHVGETSEIPGLPSGGYDRASNRTRKKNKRGDIIEKWDQTDSPEIPERGETSEMPGRIF